MQTYNKKSGMNNNVNIGISGGFNEGQFSK
jgi:hypothetical protein